MTHNVFSDPNFLHFGGDADVKFRFGATVSVDALPTRKGARPIIKAVFGNHLTTEWSPTVLADFVRRAQVELAKFPKLVDTADCSGILSDLGDDL